MGDELKPEDLVWLVSQKMVAHSGEGTMERRDREAWNARIDRLFNAAARAQSQPTSGDDREEIARIIDHEGYWERLDSCNHALATVSMTDDQRRALTAVRDDELRGTASSLAKADAILVRQGPGPGEAVAWRPEVVAFANLMETQLRANDYKPGWKGEFAEELFPRIKEEAEELREAIAHHARQVKLGDVALFLPQSIAEVGREAADVANFAMMIADVCGALAATPTREA